ncbi:ankyrin repeat domain-containing protein [Dyadobacter psychrotolerans]|uniref:Ankyrin repeat domain-containing protein n=1 Tax=Dyadobacter psychrotolerans TaxID=2541721 RepID=A0A4V2Z2J0_9BACT|nr:ankyrin repeat domain-containing protein [Dyadobacter psychrotolerans]TDE09038.1 ankyrin repeat domain-containing protein [Dyadobacter psychrotolerans]
MKNNKVSRMSTEVIQLLLAGDEHAAILHLNSLDSDGRSPLFYSLFLEKTDLLNKLILSGANINLQDKLGWTTLHHSVQ